MSAISNLSQLLKSMNPQLHAGEYVFVTITHDQYKKLNIKPLMMFQEEEGTTLILEKSQAEHNNFSFVGLWSWITLNVHSDLEAVGFTAAFARLLGDVGISANVVAAYYHDHVFVSVKDAKKAMEVLKNG